MVERQAVEALLADTEHKHRPMYVRNDTLAALCRAWLALEEAPVTELELGDFNRGLLIDDPRISAFEWEQRLAGQRVRIVKEAGE